MDYDYTSTAGTNDYLGPNVYNVAQLSAGLSALSFGYSYSQTVPHKITYTDGPNDTTGAVDFFNILGGTLSQGIVTVQRAVPSQINWIGSGSASWSVSSNWSVVGGTLQRVPLSGDTPTFNTTGGTVNLNANQTVGSLYFNSSNSYTIAPGTGSNTLTLSNTATIWIDAGLHTIAAPWPSAGR